MEYRQQGFIVANHLGKKITPALVTKLTEEKNLEFNDLNTYFKTKHNNYKISHTLMAISEAILMKDSEKKNVYLFRHYVNFIIGFLTIILTYKITRIKFSRNIALIISIFFMSTPIIVSNFNFNPNDIWFMLFVNLSTFCSLKLINKPDSKLLIFLLPLSLAFSINIRLVGIYIFFIFLIFYIYEKISLKKKLFNIFIIVN